MSRWKFGKLPFCCQASLATRPFLYNSVLERSRPLSEDVTLFQAAGAIPGLARAVRGYPGAIRRYPRAIPGLSGAIPGYPGAIQGYPGGIRGYPGISRAEGN